MKIPIKFVWGSTHVIIGRWHVGLFCIYERSTGANARSIGTDQGSYRKAHRRLAISVRGLVLWGAALMIAAYFSTALIVHKWLEHRPFNLVTLQDCVLYPARRDVIKEKQGRAFIADGLSDIKSASVRAGMQKLLLGIARYPQETTGRLVLAKIYVLLNARAKAVDLLRAGLPYTATNRPYMENVLKFASEGEDFDLWLDACDDGLAQSTERPDLAGFRRWMTQRNITGLTESGATGKAVQLAEISGADTDEEFAELKTFALLKTGEITAAATFIDAWQKRNGQSKRLLSLQVRVLREAGRREDMEHTLDAWRQRDALDNTPYISLIVNRALLHDKVATQDAIDAFFFRFGSYPENILKLSEALVPLGNSSLSKQCIAQAKTQGFATFTLRQLLMETCLTAGEWEEARAQLATLAPLHPPKDSMAVYWQLSALLVEATLDPSDGAQSNLVSFTQDQRLSLVSYNRLISVMRTAGRTNTALEIADLAHGQYPNSPGLIKTRATLGGQLAATQAAKPVITIIRPKRIDTEQVATAARAIIAETEDEPLFFKNLDDQIKNGKTSEALSSIRSAREAKPDWFNARENELALLEIRLSAAQNDPLAVQGFTRLYLNGDLDRSKKILSLANAIQAGGDTASAIVLIKEILRKAPDFSPAKKLLGEWSPSQKTGGEKGLIPASTPK